MRMLFSLTVFLTAVTATSGLAGNDSPKEEASLTWTGGHITEKVTVVIDGYTHNSILTSGDSVPLGTQIILVCRVAGLPYGTPLSYTWTCPSGPCEVEGDYGRKVNNEHILAVNTTSIRDGRMYTCQVTATGGQEATGSFSLTVTDTGGRVVHSDGRLIPYQFPITDPHQISYLTKEGLHGYRVTCNVSRPPPPRFYTPNGTLTTGGMTEENYQRSAILDVNISTFQNSDMYCDDNDTNYFYLYLTSSDNIPAPGVNAPRVTSSQVDYETTAHSSATRVIAGYEVTRFGVPMIGQYVNTGRGSRVTISPAVPGAQYRITAWALDDGRRSATPTVVDATTGEADPSPPRNVTITRVFQDGVELNWLPPSEPNGEVRYVVEYKREDSGNWTSVSTTSDSTHYNLTGLHSGTSYTIRAVAVKGAGQTSNIPTPNSTSTPTASSTATPTASSTATPTASSTATPTGQTTTLQFKNTRESSGVTAGGKVDYVGITASVMVLVLLTLLGLTVGITTGVMLRRRAVKKEKFPEINAQTQERRDQERSGVIELGGATAKEEGKEAHIYDVVGDDTSIDGRAELYQGLDVGTLDYVSEYTELRGGAYQELDLKGREEEHHYQTVYVHGL